MNVFQEINAMPNSRYVSRKRKSQTIMFRDTFLGGHSHLCELTSAALPLHDASSLFAGPIRPLAGMYTGSNRESVRLPIRPPLGASSRLGPDLTGRHGARYGGLQEATTNQEERSKMGYWTQNAQGNSFAETPEGEPEMIWGDAPADVMGDALDVIIRVFQRDVGRAPTKAEILAGVEFSVDMALEDACPTA